MELIRSKLDPNTLKWMSLHEVNWTDHPWSNNAMCRPFHATVNAARAQALPIQASRIPNPNNG
jgi:hypothetical protein